MKTPLLTALFLTAALAGCGGGSSGKSGAPPVVARQSDPAACGATAFARTIGQPLTALPGDEVPGTMRILLPGDAATADFDPMRLNVSLNDRNQIAALSCG